MARGQPPPLSTWDTLRLSVLLSLSPTPPSPRLPVGSPPITIVCISDTHSTTPTVPPGDVLLHAGDLTAHGTLEQMRHQLAWLRSLPHAHKVVIAGNNDRVLDPTSWFARGDSAPELDWGDIVYLEHSSTTLHFPEHAGRELCVYGSPDTPAHGSYPFQYPPDEDVWYNTVPPGTAVLLTHGPPKGYLDGGFGCAHLLREVWRVRPRLVVFGHVHRARGVAALPFDALTRARDVAVAEGVVPGWAEVLALVLWAWVCALARVCGVEEDVDEIGEGGVEERGGALLVNAASTAGAREEPLQGEECYTVVQV